jgi:sugar-phosphatase
MTLGRPVAAVLLDMDGTLVDSDAAVARAWGRWAGWHGVDVGAIATLSPGKPAGDVVRLVAPHLGDEEVEREARSLLALQHDDLSDVVAAEGAVALVQTLEALRLPWAVVTSADRRLALARLGAAGIPACELVTVEDVREGKPSPEGYLLAAARLRAHPSDCLVVEDSPAGVEAGRRAGMRVAGLRGAGGDVAIRDLGELSELLSGG